MNLTDLRALQSRVRECNGADRQIDFDVYTAFKPAPYPLIDVPKLTTYPDGLGACVSLMEAVFPGSLWTKTASGRYRVWGDDPSLILGTNPLNLLSDAEPLANDCLTFIDAIISASVHEMEAADVSAK